MTNIFCIVTCFFSLTKLLTSCISFPTAVKAGLVDKLELLDILPSMSKILAL